MLTPILSTLSLLITPSFWSRLVFLTSYLATSFLVLEALRLIYTDANKREVEQFLANYAGSTQRPLRKQMMSVNIDNLERDRAGSTRKRDADEKILADSRRRAATSEEQSQPARRLRKRSDTLGSSSSSEARRKRSDTLNSSGSSAEARRKRSDTLNSTGSSGRRHLEASPASEAASSRHASPRPSVRKRKAKV